MIEKLLLAGLALIDVPSGSKKPRQPGWNLRSNLISESSLDRTKDKNIGLAHAYSRPTPTCAIDIDHFSPANKWLQSNSINLKNLLHKPDAVVIHSGRPQSIKLLYRLPDGSPLPTKQISDENQNSLLEFRCGTSDGRTVHDLIPPSIHPSGSIYRWLGSGDPCMIPPIPEPLLSVWIRELSNIDRRGSKKYLNASLTQRQLSRVLEALNFISADCGYVAWRDIVWSLLSTDDQRAADAALAWSQTSEEKFTEAAFEQLVSSFNRHHQPRHSLGTLFFHAKRGGWNE